MMEEYTLEVGIVPLGVSRNQSNATYTMSPPAGRDENLAQIEILVQAVILILAVGGNSMVLLVLACRRQKLSRMNLLIAHLAAADLFVAFFNVLPQMIWDITYRFYGGDVLCRLVKYFQVVAMYSSSYVLLTTAIDRYTAIIHPLSSHMWTTSRINLLVLIAWIISFVFSIPQLKIFSYKAVSPDVYDCWGDFPKWGLEAYITWITCAIYIIPFLMLSFLYGRICLAVWRSMSQREPTIRHKSRYQRVANQDPSEPNSTKDNNSLRMGSNTAAPRAHVRTMSKSKLKTVKLTLAVITCYLVCWGPFFIAQMWAAWDPHAPFTGNVMVIILLLASLNSCTNPWIYMAFTDNICKRVSFWINRRAHRRQSERSDTFESESRIKNTYLSKTDTMNCNKVLFYANENAIQMSSLKIKAKTVASKTGNGNNVNSDIVCDSDVDIPKGTPV